MRRNHLGISQEELAARAGLHRTYVSDVERGARNVTLVSVASLAAALELSVTKLLTQSCDPESPEALDDSDAEAWTPGEILMVEDDPHDVELTRRSFRKAKVRNPLRVIHDGAAALEYLFAPRPGAEPVHPPHLILLDLALPYLSGIEVLRRIKSDPRTRAIPVVILTGSQSQRDIAECRRLGAAHYIVKPVGFENFSMVTAQLDFTWAMFDAART